MQNTDVYIGEEHLVHQQKVKTQLTLLYVDADYAYEQIIRKILLLSSFMNISFTFFNDIVRDKAQLKVLLMELH